MVATTTTAGLIGWAGICASYLRFRRAYQQQGLQHAIVPEARSPLQPWLAWYGMLWALFLSTLIRPIRSDILATFQGYLIFTRNSAYWSIVSTSWGFTLSPYVLCGTFCLLILAWLVFTRFKQGRWTWQVKALKRIDLTRGRAPKLVPPSEVSPLRNALRRFLDAL